jgi:hypothetical protein
MAVVIRASRQQLLATRPKTVMAPFEWPATPIFSLSTRPASGEPKSVEAESIWSMTKVTSPGWLCTSAPLTPPGVPA